MSSIVVVTPRPPNPTGSGDQIRAAQIVQALEGRHEVSVCSWLEDASDRPRLLAGVTTRTLRRLPAHLLYRPIMAAWCQLRAGPVDVQRHLDAADLAIFVTERAIVEPLPRRFIIDYIDDLAASAERRARASGPITGRLWSAEARRSRRWAGRVRPRSSACTAISPIDSESIGPGTTVIPNWMAIPEAAGGAATGPVDGWVTFHGNLHYGPNHEAACWIADVLAPALDRIEPSLRRRLLIAGRRARPELVDACRRQGVRLLSPVDDMHAVLCATGLAIAPLVLGGGVQNKVLDAVARSIPVVLTPHVNAPLALRDDRSAFVAERTAASFAAAVHRAATLAPASRRCLVETAREDLRRFERHRVVEAWRTLVDEALGVEPATCPPTRGS
jgi:polysaccharide biosynthesis protein PslH